MEALEEEKTQLEEHMSKTRGLMTAMQVQQCSNAGLIGFFIFIIFRYSNGSNAGLIFKACRCLQ